MDAERVLEHGTPGNTDLERYLTLWAVLTIVGGVALGFFVPELGDALRALSTGVDALPLAHAGLT